MFWHLFCNSFKIDWPYEFRDCYTRNLETGEYKMAESFDTRIADINAWTMRADIFKRWPEFYADFPRSLDHLPMHLAFNMPPPMTGAQASMATRMIEAPGQHSDGAQTVASESVNGSEIAMEEHVQAAYWDPLQAAIIDASYSAPPEKGLVDLLGQGHYGIDFGGRVAPVDYGHRFGNDFVF